MTDCEQAFAAASQARFTLPTLLDNNPESLAAASERLASKRRRIAELLEWCAALLVLGIVFWLAGYRHLAFGVGAGAVAALAMCALTFDDRRRLLVSLVAQGDANSIPEVRELAQRLAHDPDERRRIASSLRTAVRAATTSRRAPMIVATGRVNSFAPRLLALADAIGDERRAVSPPAVALCRRLLTDGAGSPLYNPQLPEGELERVLAAVEAGIEPAADKPAAGAVPVAR